jgi:hypothetical protein
MRLIVAATLLVVFAVATPPPPATIEDAQRAVANNDYTRARDLYSRAIEHIADARQRDRALITLANIDWRVFHDGAAARAALDRVSEGSNEVGQAIVERARIAAELDRDGPAAIAIAKRAFGAEIQPTARIRAIVIAAQAAIEPLIRERLAGHCGDATTVGLAEKGLQGLIAARGPFIRATRPLLDAALLTGDGPTALEAWRWYYGLGPGVPVPNQLITAGETLAHILPAWQEKDRRALGLALAQSRLFREAALVFRDPCTQAPLAHDPEVDAVIAYEESLRHIEEIADEHYRLYASGHDDTPHFHKAIEDEGRALWPRLGHTEAYSRDALDSDLARRFGTKITMGVTNGVNDMHLGHIISDDDIDVEQYGRRARLHVILVDGLISNGFLTWALDGNGGDGGTATDQAIYQFRPMYADGPLIEWVSLSDKVVRAERDQIMAEETARDEQRAVNDPNGPLPGLNMRLRREYDDEVMSSLRAQGLDGAALREAFMARVRTDDYASSIVAHEGRHAIDKKHFSFKSSADLEYRAKLSEVALAHSPRGAIAGHIFAAINADSPHGQANRRIETAVAKWMKQHAAEIAGLDTAKPLLPQFDKLTDEQIRTAFRSLDPLAAGASGASR